MTDENGTEKRETLETSENRTSMIAIRVTPSEHELIRARALDAGVTVTDLLIRAALGADVLMPLKVSAITNQDLVKRIERIERVLIDAGVILEP